MMETIQSEKNKQIVLAFNEGYYNLLKYEADKYGLSIEDFISQLTLASHRFPVSGLSETIYHSLKSLLGMYLSDLSSYRKQSIKLDMLTVAESVTSYDAQIRITIDGEPQGTANWFFDKPINEKQILRQIFNCAEWAVLIEFVANPKITKNTRNTGFTRTHNFNFYKSRMVWNKS